MAVPALVAGGLLILAGLGLRFGGHGHQYRVGMELFLVLGLVEGAATLGLAALATRKAGLGFPGLLRLLSDVWVRPPGDWVMFVFGILVSLPLASFLTTVLIGDSDSARIIASIQYVRHQDWRYLIHTQENYLPHIVMPPILAIGGIPALKLFTILTLQGLAGVVSFITWKVTHNGLAALASVAALLSFYGMAQNTALLPMYPTMLALGYGGTYLAYRAIVSDSRRQVAFAAVAGLSLALSPEAQPVGQLFLLMPILLVAGTGLRRALPGLVRVYVALTLFLLPRAIINLSEGGLSHVLSYRVDFWITKGYLVEVQKGFFYYPSRFAYPEYFIQLVRHAPRIAGRLGLIVVMLAIVGLVLSPVKVRRVAVVMGGYVLAPFLLARAPFFPRYFSPFLVGAALVVGIGSATLLAGRWPLRRVGVGVLLGLCILAVVNMAGTLRQVRGRQAAVVNGPYHELTSRIRDRKGVIGARSLYLLFVDPNLRTYGTQFLSEKEYVTYLTWPSDEAVIRVLRAHGIGWVLIAGSRWEIAYNDTWLLPAYGQIPRQPSAVAASSKFCLALDTPPFRLYKLGCSKPG